jgi:hypothetical protein
MTPASIRETVRNGILAGLAYAATAEIDNRISGKRLDDLALLGRPFVPDERQARKAGLAIHLANSVVLAGIFQYVRRWIPGGSVSQGVTFALVENTLLYPIAALEDLHPGIRNNEIDRYFTLPAYLLSIPRHIAYGVVLGFLAGRSDGAR